MLASMLLVALRRNGRQQPARLEALDQPRGHYRLEFMTREFLAVQGLRLMVVTSALGHNITLPVGRDLRNPPFELMSARINEPLHDPPRLTLGGQHKTRHLQCVVGA